MSQFCGECGTERVRPEQRFCGSCGALLEATAAPPAAAPPVAGFSATPPSPSTGQLDYAVPSPPTPRRRTPLGPVVAAAAVILALVGAGLVAWQVLGPKGGAESPEEAVSQLITAAVGQDPVGALEMVNPGEVAGLDNLYETAYDRAEKEGLTGGDQLTDALDVSVDGLTFNVDELSDSAARVVLTGGSYSVTFEPDRLPDRLSFIADEYPNGRTWEGDILNDLGDDLPDLNWENDRPEPYLDAVRIDDRWYVSLFGTYVDLWFEAPSDADFREADVRAPDYDAVGEAPEPIVAKEPEDVLKNLADAASSEDVAELLANFPTDQAAALRPWASTLEDIFASEDMRFDVAVSNLDVETQQEGDLMRLTIDQGSVTAAAEDDGDTESVYATIDGRCVEGYDDYGSGDRICLEGNVARAGIDEFFLMLREVDGGYQIDPLATAIAYGRRVVDSAPASMIDDALESICTDLDEEMDC